jgi:hypothetical protein
MTNVVSGGSILSVLYAVILLLRSLQEIRLDFVEEAMA